MSRSAAHYNLREQHAQTTPMLCPAYSPSTSQTTPTHDSNVVPRPTTKLQDYSAAHDLMSCPKLHNTNLSFTQQSVRIQKPIPATVKKYPEIPLSQIFYPKQPRNFPYTFLYQKTNIKHQDNAQKLRGTMSYCFSLKKQ